MHFSPAFVLAALPFLAAARLPHKNRRDNPAYTLVAIHSGDQAVDNQPIVASNESFFIGAESSATCSSDSNAKCNAPTQVIFADSALLLNSKAPFAQQVFVTQNGTLAYTSPNDVGFPDSEQASGFSRTTDPTGETLSLNTVVLNGTSYPPGWLACPNELDGTANYQIIANVSNVTGFQVSGTSTANCHDIAIALVPANATAAIYQFNRG